MVEPRSPAALDEDLAGTEELTVPESALGTRLDKYLATVLPDRSRTAVQSLIEGGNVRVAGVVRKANHRLSGGEQLTIAFPPPAPSELRPEAIPLDIRYEDDDLLVLNKPVGLVVHPAPGHPTGTLVNALLYHVPGISVGGVDRPGLVHRLDRDTSGLMVVAKSDRGHRTLVSQWETRSVDKGYLALAQGDIDPDEATIDVPIARDPQHRQRMAAIRGGRDAVTHFTVRERFDVATLLELVIETGRTHQIRVHLAFIGHPVVGDHIYGAANAASFGATRQMLHAHRLGFRLPSGKQAEFVADPPADFARVLTALRESTARE